MIFKPQTYRLPDRPGEPFIDSEEIENLLAVHAGASAAEVEAVIGRAMTRQRLSLSETAVLLGAGPRERERVLAAAERLKREVYGSRIVLFAPLYVGNRCTNR